MKLNNIPTELRQAALYWLKETDPLDKSLGVRLLYDAWQQRKITLDEKQDISCDDELPGRPDKPVLVSPKEVKKRSLATVEGRVVLLHALAHIEFNAINLALDIMWRFPHMPMKFYVDWLVVAKEESLHFSLLNNHLKSLGCCYGDFPAHNSLWELAERTQDDLLARIAMVPRTMEARGLDATPAIREKLSQAGDKTAAAIVDIILRDEIGHVAFGDYWFKHLCEQADLNPEQTYQQLIKQYAIKVNVATLNKQARMEAGFSEAELNALIAKAAKED
jgi:uncharacterized ferritin-like protein (DUF455 family)